MKKLTSLAVLLLLSVAGAAVAQTGGVTGIVVDGDGVPVEEARVSLWVEGTCAVHVSSDADGVFLFEDIDVGIYTLKAGKQGVGRVELEGVEVLEGETIDVGTLTLEGTGPHGPGNQYKTKFQLQHQEQGPGDE